MTSAQKSYTFKSFLKNITLLARPPEKFESINLYHISKQFY